MHGSLDNLERWLQDEIVRPLERRSNAGGARRSIGAAESILPSQHLAPRERVAIYSGMYVARLQECLESDFPALARLVGPKQFERLVRAYLRKFPSRHYSLNALGSHMAEFLDGNFKIARRALLADIARLELAMSEVFDSPQSELLTPADLTAISPAAWPDLRLRLVQAFQLHAFAYRANAVVTALRQEKSLPDLRREPTWVAVYRKEWVVWRMDLSRPMFEILSALKRGEPLSQALAAGAESFDGSPEELHASVARWFSEWTAEGFFSAIERSE